MSTLQSFYVYIKEYTAYTCMKMRVADCRKMVAKGLNCHKSCHMTSLQHHGVIVPDWCLVISSPGVIMMSQARGVLGMDPGA